MSSPAERNKKLAEVFKFTDTDLLLNKGEQVSDGQNMTLKSHRQGRMISLVSFVVMIVIFALVCAGVGISLVVSPQSGGSIMRPAILFATGVAMLLLAASAANFYLRSGDILSGKVSRMQGAAELYTRQYRDEYRSWGMGWFVKLNKKEFRLQSAAQYAALEEGAPYRIYYIKGYPLDLLLTIEAL